MNLEAMLKEELELEKQMFGEVEEESVTDDNHSEGHEETITPETIPTTEVTVSVEEESPVEPKVEEPKPSTDWKKRFSSYKASTDITIADLRRENAVLLDKLKSMTSQVDSISEQLKAQAKNRDIFEDVITQEDTDLIGQEAVDIMKKATAKATEEATAPLEAELKRLKELEAENLKQREEAQRRRLYEIEFLEPLERAVPDFTEIDRDPEFLQYLEEVDEFTGVQRKVLFGRAEQARSVATIATFFNDFKSLKAVPKKDVRETKVTPVATGGGADNGTPKVNTPARFSASEYEKHYRDWEQGKYRGKEKEWKILEAKLDKAYMTGNIY